MSDNQRNTVCIDKCVLCRYKEISQEPQEPQEPQELQEVQAQPIEENPIEQPVQPTSECLEQTYHMDPAVCTILSRYSSMFDIVNFTNCLLFNFYSHYHILSLHLLVL